MAQQVDQQGHVGRSVVVGRFEEDDLVRHGIKTKLRSHRGEFAAVDDNAAQSARLTQRDQKGMSHLLIERGQGRNADRNDLYPGLSHRMRSFTNGSAARQNIANADRPIELQE